jgi:hypothetical protein
MKNHKELTDLLTLRYEKMTLEQRITALRFASALGSRHARDDEDFCVCDCPQPAMPHECPDEAALRPIVATESDYYYVVLEPSPTPDDMVDPGLLAMKHSRLTASTDPRVQAFICAANAVYRERFASVLGARHASFIPWKI